MDDGDAAVLTMQPHTPELSIAQSVMRGINVATSLLAIRAFP